jgi:cytochrome c-type biogenesis protein CcmH/NrfG
VPAVPSGSGCGTIPRFSSTARRPRRWIATTTPGAAALARSAIGHYPDFVLAHFLLGQAALALGRWDDAETAFRTVVTLYPGSVAGRRALQTAVERAGQRSAPAATKSEAS